MDKQVRSFDVEMRADEQDKRIEGYFIVFDEPTMLWEGFYEQVDRTAIPTLDNKDIKALFDHDSSRVLGRTTNNTLTLKVDDKGLFGSIKINELDTEAVNLYERVKRGDIDQCSFGFYIKDEELRTRDDGSTLSILKDIELLEVSVVTFPAYPTTSVSARKKDFENYKREQFEQWKKSMRERLSKQC